MLLGEDAHPGFESLGAFPVAFRDAHPSLEARKRRKKAVILPVASAREAAVVEGIDVYGVANLREAFEFLIQQRELQPVTKDVAALFSQPQLDGVDFAEVKGRHNVKRAIEVAVAGNHALLTLWSIWLLMG